MTEFFDKIKTWALGITAAITAVFIALFFYERNKNIVDSALLKQQALDKDLDKDNAQIATNNQALQAEQANRDELEKESTSEPSDQNVIDLFNSRK